MSNVKYQGKTYVLDGVNPVTVHICESVHDGNLCIYCGELVIDDTNVDVKPTEKSE